MYKIIQKCHEIRPCALLSIPMYTDNTATHAEQKPKSRTEARVLMPLTLTVTTQVNMVCRLASHSVLTLITHHCTYKPAQQVHVSTYLGPATSATCHSEWLQLALLLAYCHCCQQSSGVVNISEHPTHHVLLRHA